MSPLLLLTISSLVCAAAFAAWRGRHGARLASRRRRRDVQNVSPADQPGTEEGWARMTAEQILHDGLQGVHALWRSVAAWAISMLVHHNRRVDDRKQQVMRARAEADRTQEMAAADQNPSLPARESQQILRLLFAGDLGVIASALMAHDGELTVLFALIIAIALAAALFMLGHLVGHLVRDLNADHKGTGRLLAIATFLLLGFATSLLLLRAGQTIAWFLLSISPAIGAAATIVLGPTNNQRQAYTDDRAAGRAERRQVTAMRRRGWTNAIATVATTKANLNLGATVVQANAETTRLDIDAQLPNVTAGVAAIGIDGLLENADMSPSHDLDVTVPFVGSKAMRSHNGSGRH